MQPMKNVAASAKSGMEKTKASVQEKVERMTSRDPVEKEEATQKKDARIAQAEMEKQEAQAHNANTHSHSATGPTGHSTGYPTGHGVVGSHPLGSNTGTTAHNSRVGGTGPTTHNY